MTDAVGSIVPAPVLPGNGARGQARVASLTAVGVAVAFTVWAELHQLFAYHELYADLGYDDGVWFGSAVRLAHGYLPYKSFVLEQPPGVPLLTYPFGLLSRVVGTRTAFATARLTMPLIGASTVAAVGWLVRHRGALAVLAGSGAVAIYPVAVVVQRSVMLEPFCAMFCLLGLAASSSGARPSARSGRLFVGGALFGLAGTCKGFAILPFVVVAVVIMVTQRRRIVAFIGGAAASFVLVCAPFAAIDPKAFFHQVVTVQLTRSETIDPSRFLRLLTLTGFLWQAKTRYSVGHAEVVVALAATVLVVATLAAYVPTRGSDRYRGITPLDMTAFGMVAVTAYGLITPAAFYAHYAAFLGPFLGLLIGVIAGRLGFTVRRIGRPGPIVLVTVTAVALVAGSVHAVSVARAYEPPGNISGLVRQLIPPGSCVLADDPETLLLANRFVARSHSCDPLVDAYGTTISTDGGIAPRAVTTRPNATARLWRRTLKSAGYLVLANGFRPQRIPWQTTSLRNYVRHHFRTLARAPEGLILVRIHPLHTQHRTTLQAIGRIERAASAGRSLR